MRSTEPAARDRIRDAALDLFGRDGFEATSVRQVAAAAGVSPGLVIHHFGSKDGLRQVCDDHVFDFLKQERRELLLGRLSFTSPSSYVADHPRLGAMARYLGRALAGGNQTGRRLFDRMVDDARENLEVGERNGSVRPSADPAARAVLVAAWGAASLLIGDLMAARLGGDQLLDPEVTDRLSRVALEIYLGGMLEGSALPAVLRSVAEASA